MAFIKWEFELAMHAAYFLGRKHERDGHAYPDSLEHCVRLVAEREAAENIKRELDIFTQQERAAAAVFDKAIEQALQKSRVSA
jgi:hypothetical protein